MSRRRKLEKFAELLSYDHVFEMTEIGSDLVRQSKDHIFCPRGKWHTYPYPRNQPLCVELACGRGEYSLGLASLYPEKNFLGVDIKGSRIHSGATIALKEQMSNVAFLRIRIEQIALFFEDGEIDEMWITFPDPFPAKENRRLTSKMFLDLYYPLLASGATVHLKTDDDDLYFFSVETVKDHPKYRVSHESENISEIRKFKPELNIKTFYEKQHLKDKKTIKYLQFEKID